MMASFMLRWRQFGATTLLTIATATMAGCAAQSTPANRFTLPEVESPPSSAVSVSSRQLAVSPVEVASYLDQEGIVMQTSDIELNAANQNLWAEELGHQLTRQLRQSLSAELPGTTVVSAAQGGAGAQRLSLSVDQFQGRYDGRALASGEWQLHDGNRLVMQRHFEVTRPLDDDGYPALVRALGAVWKDVARQVAAGVRATPAQTPTAN